MVMGSRTLIYTFDIVADPMFCQIKEDFSLILVTQETEKLPKSNMDEDLAPCSNWAYYNSYTALWRISDV